MGTDAQGPGTAQEPTTANGRQQGSTLIEALLSVTLLGLATLSALQASTQATQRSRSAQQRALAVQWSAELAERLQADVATNLAAWQSQAGAALAAGTAPLDDAVAVTAIPATPTTPAQWQVHLRWIDPADQRPAAHHAVIERPLLPP